MANPIWLQDTVWRESGRQINIGPVDGRLLLFFVLFMLFPNRYFFGFLCLALIFFYALSYIGYTLPNALRKISALLSGKKRNAIHYWRQNKFR